MTGEGSNPPVFCLGFDIHYPCRLNPGFRPDLAKGKRNLKDIYFSPDMREGLGWAIETSFRPATEILLDLLDEGFKCALGMSGVVLERLEKWYPDMLDLLSRAATHENAEVLAQTYYHSVAGLFADPQEFTDELLMHRDLTSDLFGVAPTTFVHTDYPITPATAEALTGSGIRAAIIEGAAAERDPGHTYTYRDLPVLVTHCDLSDDIAVRFPRREWDRWPLMADRYAEWISKSPGESVTLYLDYRVFGDLIGPETGILEFLRALPSALADAGVRTMHPSDAANNPPHGIIDDTAGPGHQRSILQQSALEALEDAGSLVADPEIWRYLLDTDHIRRMAMRSTTCGRPLHAVSHQVAHNYFAAFMRILSHLEERSAASARSQRAVLSLRCVPPEFEFTFSSHDRPVGYAAHNLQELADMLEFTPDDVVRYHAERGDFYRWIGEVIGDSKLAKEVQDIDDRIRLRTTIQGRIDSLWKRLR
ncbi:MAG: alpha-amylase [Methanomicrobiales archaeon]|nr:alpha-amylase [Methanomicrobiales archaeon]